MATCRRLVQQWVITKVDIGTPDEEKDCNACQYDLDLDDTRWFHKQIYSYFLLVGIPSYLMNYVATFSFNNAGEP